MQHFSLEDMVVWDEAVYPRLLPGMINDFGAGPFKVVGLELNPKEVIRRPCHFAVIIELANGVRQKFAGKWFKKVPDLTSIAPAPQSKMTALLLSLEATKDMREIRVVAKIFQDITSGKKVSKARLSRAQAFALAILEECNSRRPDPETSCGVAHESQRDMRLRMGF